MPVNMTQLLVLLVCLAVASSASVQDAVSWDSTREWPCPIDADILPCVCVTDEVDSRITMDCSAAITDNDLEIAFTADFSFPDMYELIIDQNGCDECNLQTINQATFGVTSFERIIITDTNISIINEEAFGNSHPTLVVLRLSNNEITTFNFEAIGSYQKLNSLILNGNKFDGVIPIPNIESATLYIINLSNNPQLVFQSHETVKNCPELREVDFSTGGIHDVPMDETLTIGMFNELQNIETVTFTTNSLTEVLSGTVVAPATTLLSVDFSNNQITDVFTDFVLGFDVGGVLDMSNNNITLLDPTVWESVFADVATDEGIIMSGNPLRCGCEIAWIVTSENYSKVLSTDSKCEDGVQLISELPAAWFEANCPTP